MTTYELRPEVRAYYDEGGEDTRIRDGRGRLEFLRTQDVLRRVLPPAPATVLDVGGASGVHAEWLAADGYAVHVVDPVPRHVAASAGLPGVTAALGDARALAEADGSYDAVLLLGPLYHLTERAQRVAALREAARVARPGGLVAAATISRFAALFDGLRAGWYAERLDSVITVLETAVSPRTLHGFTTAYFHRAGQVPGEFVAAGLGGVAQYMVEGPAWWFGDLSDQVDDAERRASLLDGLRRVEREPSLFDASAHVLTLGSRR
jgi:SAM-dependent methyltransferase